MNLLTNKIRKWLRFFRDYQAKATARAMDNRKRNNDDLFARLGIKRPVSSIQTNKKQILFHSIVAFSIFAGISYWLVVTCFEEGRKPFFGAVFLPFLAPIIYLAAVYFLSKRK
jgi:hypothetical protein